MTYSYGGDPANSTKDAVRFLVGDTDSSEWFLSDEEIAWLDSQWSHKGSVYFTASVAAEAIASKLAREISVSSDGQTLSLEGLQQKFILLAQSLRDQHKELLAGGSIHVGGMDASKQRDPTVAPLAFGTRMHDHREAGRQDFGDLSDAVWDYGQWGEFTP